MRRVVKKYIIPHRNNNFAPHLLRTKGAAGLLVLIVFLFSISASQVLLLKYTDLAAVLSPVLVDLTNTDRTTEKIPALKVSPVLQQAAQLKANDMAAKGYFAH